MSGGTNRNMQHVIKSRMLKHIHRGAAAAAESVHRARNRRRRSSDKRHQVRAPCSPRRPMAFTPSTPASAIKATAVVPPSAVALVSSVVARRRAPVPAPALRALHGGNSARRGKALVVVSAALDDVRPAIDANLRTYLESQIVTSGQMSPAAKLTDVMSRPVQVATPGQRLTEVDAFFAAQQYSGLPVVDDDGRCIGVISHKDKAKAPNGMESTVGEVMSSPPITLTLYKTVLEAAALMLKEKVHRIPVVNEQQHVIGIVTHSDVFQTPKAKTKHE